MSKAESVMIRPYEPGDVQCLFEAARESVSTVGVWLGWCTPDFNLESAQAWVDLQTEAFKAGREYEFVICSESGRFLGGCGLNSLDRPNARANLGYWVRSSSTQRGVATNAARQLAQWAFQNTDLVRLEIVVAQGNAPSLRVAQKVGAIRESILRQRLCIHGTHHDAIMFSVIKSDGLQA
jgi:RimJ/RimL family protein N-acetyltransferase